MNSDSVNDVAIAPETQRDGTHSDVIENPEHHLHPRTGFEYPQDFPDEQLIQEMQRAIGVLCPETLPAGARVTRQAVMWQLQKVYELLGTLFGPSGEAADADDASTAAPALLDIFNFIWSAGDDGIAQARPDAALMRCGAVSWFLFPQMFDHANQKEFGILLREQASIRCPNCAERKRRLEQCVDDAKSEHERNLWREQVRDCRTHFVTTEMKKQSPNRVITEFRDRFGVKNGHMRSEAARENFRKREAAKR